MIDAISRLNVVLIIEMKQEMTGAEFLIAFPKFYFIKGINRTGLKVIAKSYSSVNGSSFAKTDKL